MSASPFDAIAASYDRDFSDTWIGRRQRERVWTFVTRDRIFEAGADVLELNCGTGIDADWMAGLGLRVCATDQSAAMVDQCAARCADRVTSLQCSATELENHFEKSSFDVVFSNFGGLNCLTPDELMSMQRQAADVLKADGKMVTVFIAKYSWMERLYFRLRGDFTKARRREKPDMVQLAPDVQQSMQCYSKSELVRLFSDFELVVVRPVGLFIPPSYLHHRIEHRPLLQSILWWLERLCGSTARWGDQADHIYLIWRRRS